MRAPAAPAVGGGYSSCVSNFSGNAWRSWRMARRVAGTGTAHAMRYSTVFSISALKVDGESSIWRSPKGFSGLRSPVLASTPLAPLVGLPRLPRGSEPLAVESRVGDDAECRSRSGSVESSSRGDSIPRWPRAKKAGESLCGSGTEAASDHAALSSAHW